jgi:hypothetical protein
VPLTAAGASRGEKQPAQAMRNSARRLFEFGWSYNNSMGAGNDTPLALILAAAVPVDSDAVEPKPTAAGPRQSDFRVMAMRPALNLHVAPGWPSKFFSPLARPLVDLGARWFYPARMPGKPVTMVASSCGRNEKDVVAAVAPAAPHGRMPPESCHGKASPMGTNVLPPSGPTRPSNGCGLPDGHEASARSERQGSFRKDF